jgi:cytochrome oxidase Cu insertion factor (SCO1/SenC/PrrC family)
MQAEGPDKVARRRVARRTLTLLALVCAAPVVASYVAYYWLRPEARTNYGELLRASPAPDIAGIRADGTSFRLAELRGRWVLLIVDGSGCDESCERALYATRQARTIQGREQDRVARVLLQPTGAPPLSAELLAGHAGMIVVQGDSRQWQTLPGAVGLAANIYLLDPRGNLVLRYPADPDIRGLAKDMERLLRASRIG